jgi:hypothetical protein
MDPAMLAGAAVSLLIPYIERLGGKIAETATEEIADAALPKIKQLYQVIKEKFTPGTYGGNQLQAIEEKPESQGRQQGLETAILEQLGEDPQFADDLQRLVSQVQAIGETSIQARNAGVVAGRDVKQHGHYVAGRDMNIGGEPPSSP